MPISRTTVANSHFVRAITPLLFRVHTTVVCCIVACLLLYWFPPVQKLTAAFLFVMLYIIFGPRPGKNAEVWERHKDPIRAAMMERAIREAPSLQGLFQRNEAIWGRIKLGLATSGGGGGGSFRGGDHHHEGDPSSHSFDENNNSHDASDDVFSVKPLIILSFQVRREGRRRKKERRGARRIATPTTKMTMAREACASPTPPTTNSEEKAVGGGQGQREFSGHRFHSVIMVWDYLLRYLLPFSSASSPSCTIRAALERKASMVVPSATAPQMVTSSDQLGGLRMGGKRTTSASALSASSPLFSHTSSVSSPSPPIAILLLRAAHASLLRLLFAMESPRVIEHALFYANINSNYHHSGGGGQHNYHHHHHRDRGISSTQLNSERGSRNTAGGQRLLHLNPSSFVDVPPSVSFPSAVAMTPTMDESLSSREMLFPNYNNTVSHNTGRGGGGGTHRRTNDGHDEDDDQNIPYVSTLRRRAANITVNGDGDCGNHENAATMLPASKKEGQTRNIDTANANRRAVAVAASLGPPASIFPTVCFVVPDSSSSSSASGGIRKRFFFFSSIKKNSSRSTNGGGGGDGGGGGGGLNFTGSSRRRSGKNEEPYSPASSSSSSSSPFPFFSLSPPSSLFHIDIPTTLLFRLPIARFVLCGIGGIMPYEREPLLRVLAHHERRCERQRRGARDGNGVSSVISVNSAANNSSIYNGQLRSSNNNSFNPASLQQLPLPAASAVSGSFGERTPLNQQIGGGGGGSATSSPPSSPFSSPPHLSSQQPQPTSSPSYSPPSFRDASSGIWGPRRAYLEDPAVLARASVMRNRSIGGGGGGGGGGGDENKRNDNDCHHANDNATTNTRDQVGCGGGGDVAGDTTVPSAAASERARSVSEEAAPAAAHQIEGGFTTPPLLLASSPPSLSPPSSPPALLLGPSGSTTSGGPAQQLPRMTLAATASPSAGSTPKKGAPQASVAPNASAATASSSARQCFSSSFAPTPFSPSSSSSSSPSPSSYSSSTAATPIVVLLHETITISEEQWLSAKRAAEVVGGAAGSGIGGGSIVMNTASASFNPTILASSPIPIVASPLSPSSSPSPSSLFTTVSFAASQVLGAKGVFAAAIKQGAALVPVVIFEDEDEDDDDDDGEEGQENDIVGADAANVGGSSSPSPLYQQQQQSYSIFVGSLIHTGPPSGIPRPEGVRRVSSACAEALSMLLRTILSSKA